ncbi:MAG: hypothetical protein KA327_08235 [Pseudarcicella sp.]|nr:hypothetical protein [Pseudarcicella sp.]
MLKLLKYTVLGLAIFTWLLAYSPFLFKKSYEYQLLTDAYQYGDLYKLSYLPAFKQKAPPYSKDKQKKITNTNIVIIGDSFTEPQRIDSTDIISEKYNWCHWGQKQKISLNKNSKNILILETVERRLTEHFSKTSDELLTENTPINSLLKTEMGVIESMSAYVFPGSENIDKRFEVIFDSGVFLWLKERKALMNKMLFNKINKDVYVNNNQIFINEEIDSNLETSSFHLTSDNDIDFWVKNINKIKEKYLKMGFDEVYLSIIPNKVSILAPQIGNYNFRIKRIEQNKLLALPVISIYDDFKKSPQSVYLHGDTHWNDFGRKIWLKKVNQILDSQK